MKQFNADTENSVEVIEVTIEGKTYRIDKVTTEMIDAIVTQGSGEASINSLAIQLATLLSEEVEVLRKVDVRKLGRVSKYLTDTITEQIQNPKNSVGDVVTQ